MAVDKKRKRASTRPTDDTIPSLSVQETDESDLESVQDSDQSVSENEDNDDDAELSAFEAETAEFVKPIDSLVEQQVLTKAENFLVADPSVSGQVLGAAKWMFDLGKFAEPYEMSPLDELLVEGFDLDQVWEQMQLRNKPMLKHLAASAGAVLARGDIDELQDEDESSELDEQEQRMSDDDEDNDMDDLMADEDLGEDLDDNLELDGPMSDDGMEGESDEGERDDDEDVFDENEEEEDEDEAENSEDAFSGHGGRRTELDDEFFSVHEMEKFAERGEAKDMRSSQGNDDDEDDEWNLGPGLFSMDPDDLEGSDEDDDMNANDIRYEGFFAPPKDQPAFKKGRKLQFNDTVDEREFLKDKPASHVSSSMGLQDSNEADVENKKSSLFDMADSDDDETTDTTQLSKFEMEQRKLAEQISGLEAEAVAGKSWTLKGEVSGKARPVNSLLEEDMEIEHASRPTPVITEETTKTLEDLIKGRISEELFDDVLRKIAPKEKKFDPNRRNIIDEEKSSKSLTDLYEADYRKQSGEKVKTEKDLAVETAHREIDGLFKDLCMSLDALSNWHYTAKAPVAELEVVAAPSVPALTIEEVIPSVVSDAALAAPKEVYAGKVAKSEAEMEKADKIKARKAQKRAFKKQKVEKEREQKATSGNVIESVKKGKERAMASLMKQKNVTIVADSKQGKGSASEVAALKGQGGKRGRAVKANVLQQGGTIGKAASTAKPTGQSLML
ncbi:u3 small nucleolar ribonucleoprotein MPP10 [Chytriomyces hyalinus]|nr:u3 small nucleolar ribonucleoprotein MPP10 [Chytriomyces hyalinus]